MPIHRSYRWLFISLAVIALTLDLGSKYGVFAWLYHNQQPVQQGAFETWTPVKAWGDNRDTFIMGGRYNLVPGWFGFTAEYQAPSSELSKPSVAQPWNALQTVSAPIMPRVNHGALFGLGGDHEHRANSVFAGVSLVAAVAILAWGLRKANATDRWLCISLGLILGGTLGNLFDRVVFGGVRDFLYFYIIEWPVFNIADCGLVVGATMLLVQALFAKKTVPQPAANEPAMATR